MQDLGLGLGRKKKKEVNKKKYQLVIAAIQRIKVKRSHGEKLHLPEIRLLGNIFLKE